LSPSTGFAVSNSLILFQAGRKYLVYHHNRKKIAYSRKEQAIKIMLHSVTESIAKNIQYHLTDHKEENSKGDIPERPSIL
jgi:hypothetical protein